MVIHQLNIIRIACGPTETYTPLIVDANTVLSLTISREFLEAIPGRDSHIINLFSGI